MSPGHPYMDRARRAASFGVSLKFTKIRRPPLKVQKVVKWRNFELDQRGNFFQENVIGMGFGPLIQVGEEHIWWKFHHPSLFLRGAGGEKVRQKYYFPSFSPPTSVKVFYFSRYRHEIWYGYSPTILLSLVQIWARSYIPEPSYESWKCTRMDCALHWAQQPHAAAAGWRHTGRRRPITACECSSRCFSQQKVIEWGFFSGYSPEPLLQHLKVLWPR